MTTEENDSLSEAQLVGADAVCGPGVAAPRALEELFQDVAAAPRPCDEFRFERGEVL